jgi:hypothetical protein
MDGVGGRDTLELKCCLLLYGRSNEKIPASGRNRDLKEKILFKQLFFAFW